MIRAKGEKNMSTKLSILYDEELEVLKVLGEKLKKGNKTEQEFGDSILKFVQERRPIPGK